MGNIIPDFTADTTTGPVSFHEWIGDRMQVGLTMAFNDSDADGTVSMEEFVSNSAASLAQIDRNGDEMITSADLARKVPKPEYGPRFLRGPRIF